MENDFGARNFYYEVNFRRNKRLSMHSFLVSFFAWKKKFTSLSRRSGTISYQVVRGPYGKKVLKGPYGNSRLYIVSYAYPSLM